MNFPKYGRNEHSSGTTSFYTRRIRPILPFSVFECAGSMSGRQRSAGNFDYTPRSRSGSFKMSSGRPSKKRSACWYLLITMSFLCFIYWKTSGSTGEQRELEREEELKIFLNQNAAEQKYDFVYEFPNLTKLNFDAPLGLTLPVGTQFDCFNTTTDYKFKFCLPNSKKEDVIYRQIKGEGVWRRDLGILLRNLMGQTSHKHKFNVSLIVIDSADWTFQAQLILATNMSVVIVDNDQLKLGALRRSLFVTGAATDYLTLLPYSVRSRETGDLKKGIPIPPIPKYGTIRLNDLIPWVNTQKAILYIANKNHSCEIKDHLSDRQFTGKYVDVKSIHLVEDNWENGRQDLSKNGHVLWTKQ